jgi:hypothetical protein
VAIFVLTSILKELQWQIRIEIGLTVDQNAEAAVVLRVLAAQIRVVVLAVVREDLVAMIATPSQRVPLGRSVWRIIQTRHTPSQRHLQSLMKSTQVNCR